MDFSSSKIITNRQIFALISILAFVAVGFALATQHVFGMQPCVWCVFQRLICVLIGLSALIGVIFNERVMQNLSALLVIGFSATGVAAAITQHQAVLSQDSCTLTIADKVISGLKLDVTLPAVFEPQASCVEAAAKLIGVPYEFWTLLLFAFINVLAIYLLFRKRSNKQYFY